MNTKTAKTTATNGTSERRDRRAMLAEITLATDLPTPKGIDFYDATGGLALTLPTLADGIAWSQHLGGQTDTYVNTNGRRYLSEGVILWHGWRVGLHASDPVTADAPLPADTTARLRELHTVNGHGAGKAVA